MQQKIDAQENNKHNKTYFQTHLSKLGTKNATFSNVISIVKNDIGVVNDSGIKFKLRAPLDSWYRMFRRALTPFRNLYCVMQKSTFRGAGSNFLHPPFENEMSRALLLGLDKYEGKFITDLEPKFSQKSTESLEHEASKVDWEKLTTDEIVDEFEILSFSTNKNKDLSAPMHRDMAHKISAESSKMSDKQLQRVLVALRQWPFIGSVLNEYYYTIWSSVDKVLIERCNQWPIDKSLFFVDLWYKLYLLRQSNFTYKVILKHGRKPRSLSSTQLVQFLFYLNVIRTLKESVRMFDLEHRLNEVINELTLEEIGVALMGFFKSQASLHIDSLMTIIIDKFIEGSKSVPEISLACFVKCLRLSMHQGIWSKLPSLLDALALELDRLTLPCCAQIALLSATKRSYSPDLLNAVSRKLVSYPSASIRLKDMEKIIFCLVVVDYDPKIEPCIFETVKREMTTNEARENEINEFPKSAVALIHYLSLREIFLKERINQVLDMQFIRKTYGKSNYNIGWEILCLDTAVGLECPGYDGNRLPSEVRDYMSKKLRSYPPDPNKKKHTKYELLHLDIQSTCDAVLGKDMTVCKYILPWQQHADLIFKLDLTTSLPAQIDESYRSLGDFNGPIPAPKDGGLWCALVVGSRNQFCSNSERPTGVTQVKLRLLKTLGYRPILIAHHHWPNNSTGEKMEYLRKLISTV